MKKRTNKSIPSTTCGYREYNSFNYLFSQNYDVLINFNANTPGDWLA